MTTDYSTRLPSDYIRHRGPMLLIDDICHADETSIVTQAHITNDNVFFDPKKGGVPSWVGLEFMAQTAAIWVGIDDERNGRPIQLGFLLGSRSYEAEGSLLPENETISIEVSADFIDGNIMVFNGTIRAQSTQNSDFTINGNLSAFRPEDVDQYLQGSI